MKWWHKETNEIHYYRTRCKVGDKSTSLFCNIGRVTFLGKRYEAIAFPSNFVSESIPRKVSDIFDTYDEAVSFVEKKWRLKKNG